MSLTLQEIRAKLAAADSKSQYCEPELTISQQEAWNILRFPTTINVSVDTYFGAMKCPHCSGNYLHHTGIEMFDRSEDDKTGIHTTVQAYHTTWWNNDKVNSVDNDITNNPSVRRGGIRINFICEDCKSTPYLTIVQHQGQTLMCWESRK